MSMLWVGIGSAVLGAGASIYGANKQSSAINKANDANKAAQDSQNNAAWTAWLMSRGMQPTSPVAYGQVPAAGQWQATNVRLPAWATWNVPAPSSQPFRKIAPVVTTPAASVDSTSSPGSSVSNTGSKVTNAIAGGLLLGDPVLGAVVGNKTGIGKVLDPFGLFCWVAREVYSESNPKWLAFRQWMLTKAPSSLREVYAKNGPAFAEKVRQSPTLKATVRELMDGILSAEGIS